MSTFICSSCGVQKVQEELCSNAKKTVSKFSKNGKSLASHRGALRCKECEKYDQMLRYYTGVHFGFGPNASKSKEWSALSESDRFVLRSRFIDFIEEHFNGDIEQYRTVHKGKVEEHTFTAEAKDETLILVRKKNKILLAEIDNRQVLMEEGFVYVISNPQWNGMVKIGSSLDYVKRLAQYQTGDPFRSYTLEFSEYFDDRKLGEFTAHEVLEDVRVNSSREWFHCSVEDAIEVVKHCSFCIADPMSYMNMEYD